MPKSCFIGLASGQASVLFLQHIDINPTVFCSPRIVLTDGAVVDTDDRWFLKNSMRLPRILKVDDQKDQVDKLKSQIIIN